MKRKVIQYFVDVNGSEGNVSSTIFAFCDDDTVWFLFRPYSRPAEWVEVDWPQIPGTDNEIEKE